MRIAWHGWHPLHVKDFAMHTFAQEPCDASALQDIFVVSTHWPLGSFLNVVVCGGGFGLGVVTGGLTTFTIFLTTFLIFCTIGGALVVRHGSGGSGFSCTD